MNRLLVRMVPVRSASRRRASHRIELFRPTGRGVVLALAASLMVSVVDVCVAPTTLRAAAPEGQDDDGPAEADPPDADVADVERPVGDDATEDPQARRDQLRRLLEGFDSPAAAALRQELDQPPAEPSPPPPAVRTANTLIDLGDDDQLVSFTFREAPWPEVLEQFAQWAGLSLDLTDTPPGYFNYFDAQQHTISEAIDILNGYLLPRGHVVLRRDQFLAVLKTDNPTLSQLVPTVDAAELDRIGDNELVKVVVPLTKIPTSIAAEDLSPLIGSLGSVTPVPSSQSLILQGFRGPLRTVLAMIDTIQPPITDDKLDFRSFALKHLPAAEAEQQIRTLFGLEVKGRPQNVSGARQEIDRTNYYRTRAAAEMRGKDERGNPLPPPPMPLLQQVAMNMQVSALAQTNSLLVTATPEGLQLIENVLKAMDVDQDPAASSILNDHEPQLRVYRISAADEGEVAKTLDVLMPGVVINEDRRQDTIHVMATPKVHAEVQAIIRTLDDGGTDSRSVTVIPLRRSNPLAMQQLLTGMFVNDDRDARPIIQAEPVSRTLIVRGSKPQIEQIRGTLRAYGEDDADGGSSVPVTSSRFRRIDLGGRDADEVLQAAEQFHATTPSPTADGKTIRVVVPGKSNTRHGLPLHDDASVSRLTDPDVSIHDTFRVRGDRSAWSTLVRTHRTDVEADPMSQMPAGRRPQSDVARVSVEARDGELFLSSGDPAALAEVEGTIRDLIREMPASTRWNVFYLSSVDASELPPQLYELVRETDPYAAFGSMGDPNQSPLRIIADKRINALFVSGPDAKVDQIEEFLKLIDDSGEAKSYGQRVPHTILVRHADVNEVATMLKTLYADYLTDPAARDRGDRRDRDSREGRGRDRESSRDDDRRSTREDDDRASASTRSRSVGVRMTIAVDTRTNELIVSCDDVLFREVEAVVRARDLAVAMSQPTVEIVTLTETTNADELAATLQSMSPKIKTAIVSADQTEQSARDQRSRQRERDREREQRRGR